MHNFVVAILYCVAKCQKLMYIAISYSYKQRQRKVVNSGGAYELRRKVSMVKN